MWRRAVLALFVRERWLEQDAAASMLAWPHSGFSAYVGPAIASEDRATVLRVARCRACAPVAESRLRYDAGRRRSRLVSDAVDGPYVGVHRFAAAGGDVAELRTEVDRLRQKVTKLEARLTALGG